MAQQREATTDRLVGIIASIKMERRSGRLTVRRGEGLMSEEGKLVFVQGQVTEAQVGRRSGADALNWLSTWGSARYTFTTSPVVGKEAPDRGFTPVPMTSPGKVTSPLRPLAPINTDKLERGSSHILSNGVPHITVSFAEATARIERAGLSRAHRHLYQLIDGQRTTIELVPLVGRKVEEIRNMLHDLEWLGVIRVEGPPPLGE